ncbi:MAG: hypothetical protein H0U46_01535, partial [Actinobacteria bacterium]|nr:hypothetical protein [Actinomycetota bacterium]
MAIALGAMFVMLAVAGRATSGSALTSVTLATGYKEESVRLGPIRAVLSYVVGSPGAGGFSVTELKLTTFRGSQQLAQRRITCGGGCYLFDNGRRIQLARLRAGDPYAVVNLWTGGMRCCLTTRVYSVRSSPRQPIMLDWPNAGAN